MSAAIGVGSDDPGAAEGRPPLVKRLRRGVMAGMLRGALRSGLWRASRAMAPEGIDILLHHRIANPNDPAYFGFKGNISATPAEFSRQLDYLQRYHSVVSLAQFEAWLMEGVALPPRPVLITFDDGYADNHDVALPELRKRSLPAVLFLATGYVGDRQTFFWDGVADAFARTEHRNPAVPLLGTVDLGSAAARDQAIRRWIESAKTIDGSLLGPALADLGRALGCELAARPPRRTHVDWDEVRALADGGFAICAHTVNHPILARVPLSVVEQEVFRSAREIEQHLGRVERTFAYPNGRLQDFLPEHEALLAKLGFVAALRSDGGLALAAEARRRPHAIRRTCLTSRDDLPRFAAKLSGLTRLAVA